MNVKRLIYPVLCTLVVAGVSYAQDQLIGIGSAYWAVTHAFNGANGECLEATTNVCALFPASNSEAHRRRVVVAKAAGEGTCVWIGDPAAQISGASVTSGGDFSTGPGASMRFEFDGDVNHDRPSRAVMVQAETPGAALGLCPNEVGPGESQEAAGAGDVLYAPCIIGQACAAAYGGGTCAAASASQLAQSSMFLFCTTGVTVTARKERLLGPEESN